MQLEQHDRNAAKNHESGLICFIYRSIYRHSRLTNDKRKRKKNAAVKLFLFHFESAI